ncbi:heterokaryon incompatibility protein [Fusarium heterosporum]|uniref:Heterokaryon incompatibility protein n=1 Tax=Fusarium heterosporum TaxID=42747 RepID=A0A8H5TAK2_FUSHE|nr:heterokaryon incompatibility protein [Fusarium heterosporum]
MACKGRDCWLRQPDDLAKTNGFSNVLYNLSELRQSGVCIASRDDMAKDLYTRLPPGQTRLLSIQQDVDRLAVKLITVDIMDDGFRNPETGDPVPFKALSYSWGAPIFDLPLICNDVVVGITETLATALLAFREMGEPLPVWVDALCINQMDDVEKSNQVQRMADIYAAADQVITWMGHPVTDTHIALALLKLARENEARVGGFPREDGEESDSDDAGPGVIVMNSGYYKGFDHGQECVRNLRRGAAALQHHLDSVWLTRSWVRQEAHFARDMVLYYGLHSCSLSDLTSIASPSHLRELSNTLDYYSREPRNEGDTPSGPEIISSLTIPMPLKYFSDPLNYGLGEIGSFFAAGSVWLRLLIGGMRSDITDPRDRVYAYHGMAKDLIARARQDSLSRNPPTYSFPYSDPERCDKWVASVEFRVDYTRPVQRVYKDLTKHLLNYRTLRVLQLFERRDTRSTDLPSWVPDWRVPPGKNARMLVESAHPLGRNSYAWPEHVRTQFPYRRVSGRRLTLKGKVYGTVGSTIESTASAQLFRLNADHFRMGDDKCRDSSPLFKSNDTLDAQEFIDWILRFNETAQDSHMTLAEQDYYGGLFKYVNINIGGKVAKSWDVRRMGLYGMVANTAKEGDLVVWLQGGEVEMILQPSDSYPGCFVFQGPMLIRGRKQLMDVARKAELKEFTLV